MTRAFPDTDATSRFVRMLQIAGARRAQRGDDCWNREEWEAFVRRGREAFGSGPKALFGQLTLVETMLEHGLDGQTIAAELRRIDDNRAAAERQRAERQERERREAVRRAEEAEIEEAVRKERVRLEARRRTADEREQLDVSRPAKARRSVSLVNP